MAGVLAGGPDAVLARNSAARLLGFSNRGRQVDVIRPESRKGRNVRLDRSDSRYARRLQVRRTRNLPDRHITKIDGIPVTTAERTLLDQAGDLPDKQFIHSFIEADRLGLLDDTRLDQILVDGRGFNGIELLRKLVDERDPRMRQTRSLLEALLLMRAVERRIPIPEVNKRIGPYCVDFYWKIGRLVVEADGQNFHAGLGQITRDLERENHLKRRGLEVLRFTWKEVNEKRDLTLDQIEQTLHRRISQG